MSFDVTKVAEASLTAKTELVRQFFFNSGYPPPVSIETRV